MQTPKSLSQKRYSSAMSGLLSLLLLVAMSVSGKTGSLSVSAQTNEARNGGSGSRTYQPPQCPDGQKYWPGLATTSLITEAGCLSPAAFEKISLIFQENLCGETGFSWYEFPKKGKAGYGYTNGQEWNKTTKRCDSDEHYTRYLNGKATRLTKEEYYRETHHRKKRNHEKPLPARHNLSD